MANILVIRLSAIGDVAMTIPVIYSAARTNPSDRFTVLTQAFLIPLFLNRPSNVEVIGINTKAAEKKTTSYIRFAWALSKFDYDIVLDLHDVLRTKMLRTFFRLRGRKILVLDKARRERKQLTRKANKILRPLRSVIDRYSDVFVKAGLSYEPLFTSLFDGKSADLTELHQMIGEKANKWVGIAPFAKHRGKIYPIEEMEKVVEALSEKGDITIFLFGGKGYEAAVLDQWAFQYQHVYSMVGRYTLDTELSVMSEIDLLVSMDSANMHFASLVGTSVISVWGATHPYAGFYGYKQEPDNSVQLDLNCRPCSVYGQKSCWRKDWACMNTLSYKLIVDKILVKLADKDAHENSNKHKI